MSNARRQDIPGAPQLQPQPDGCRRCCGPATRNAAVSARASEGFEIDADAMRRNAGSAARLLKTLANDQRLRVLCLLIDGELSVGQINERIELSQSALSQHLAKLREERLVATRREAQTIYYSLIAGPAREIIRTLHDIYCQPPARKRAPRSR